MKTAEFLPMLVAIGLASATGSQPNIVMTLGSGLGWGDIGANNLYEKNTPNIDKLASNGINYFDYHIGGNTAGPSMAALLTGRMSQRTGVRKDFTPKSIGGIPGTEKTIADYLKAEGYMTGFIGVWDLGHEENFLPTAHGFDYFYGTPFEPSMGCVQASNSYMPGCVQLDNRNCGDSLANVPLMVNTEIIEQPVTMTNLSVSMLYAKANKFIDEAISNEQPFFLIISPSEISLPATILPEGIPTKVDLLRQLDSMVAATQEILETRGILDSSISMFSTRTGPKMADCDFSGDTTPFLGLWQTNADPYSSAGCGSNWEGALRVPFIMSLPDLVQTPYVNKQLKSAVDVLPTIAEIVGINLPTDRTFDGMSLTYDFNASVPYLLPDTTQRILYFQEPDTDEIFVIRMENLKIYFRSSGSKKCGSSYDPSGIYTYYEYPVVFDLLEDKSEFNNITYNSFQLERFIEWKSRGDKWFKNDLGLKSVVDYTESEDAIPCCSDICTCQSQPPLHDLMLLMFNRSNLVEIEVYKEAHSHMIPTYGLVIICIGASAILILVAYKTWNACDLVSLNILFNIVFLIESLDLDP